MKYLQWMVLWVSTTMLGLAVESRAAFTLDEAVQASLKANRDIQSVRESIRQAEAERGQAWSQLFPKLDANFHGVYRKDAANSPSAQFGGQPYNRYGFGFELVQPVFFRGALSGLSGPLAQARGLEIKAEILARDQILKTIRDFYTVLLEQRKVEIYRKQEQILKESLATAQRRVRIGRSERLDVLQVRTQIALLAPKIQKAQSDLATAAAILAYDIGQPNIAELTVLGDFDWLTEEKRKSLIESASRVTPAVIPEVREISENRNYLSDQSTVASGKYWPNLSVAASWGRSAFDESDLLTPFATTWEVGLKLNFPIFSGLASVYEGRSYAAQLAKIDVEEAKAREQVSLREIRASKGMETLQETVRYSEVALKISTESLAEARRSYSMSTIDYLQYLTIQQAYMDSQLTTDQYKVDYLVSVAEYLGAVGVPLDGFLQATQSTGISQ